MVNPTAEAQAASSTPLAKKSKLIDITADISVEAESNAVIYEYQSAANPALPPVPVKALSGSVHSEGPTRVIPFDLSSDLGVDYPATTPNLLASFLRVVEGEALTTTAKASSQAFYAIRGKGRTEVPGIGSISWSEGDLFVIPRVADATHHADTDSALYHVHDGPLLAYLGVSPTEARFSPALFRRDTLRAHVEEIRSGAGSEHRNRLGILLSNRQCPETKTLSHTLWSLLNCLPARTAQKPHKHNSVALDLAVCAAPGVYTLMGPEIDEDGSIVDGIRVDWSNGGAFTTPPGWWHSHHNDSDSDAWVLPMQDAGLYTYQRTLDIRFLEDELDLIRAKKRRGATFPGSHVDLAGAAGSDSAKASPAPGQ